MYQIIDGKAIAKKVKDNIAQEVNNLKSNRPNLAIILIGDRPDSQLYVSLKEREGKRVGIDTHLYKFEADAQEEEILEVINFLNKDELIDGILVQLPLPSNFNTDKIINSIKPEKDVDGFHPKHPDYIISPVLASVKACLDDIVFKTDSRKACVFHNSQLFGEETKRLLKKEAFEIVSNSESTQADLIITALGQPGKINKKLVKEGAAIIDIGITKKDDKVQGDVDTEDLKDYLSYLTPVPGGIGPMTIAFLFKNVLEIYKRRA